MSNLTEPKAHPFELAGMGVGPYTFGGIYEMPDISENSAANFANSNPYAGAPKLKAGLGTCANCGMAITVVCIVKDANGDLWGVGSDCVEKAGDKCLGETAKVAVAKRRAIKRREANDRKREQERQKWLNTVCNAQGETNRARLAREERSIQEEEKRKFLEIGARAAKFHDEIQALIEDGSEFAKSIANQIPFGPLTSRQAIPATNIIVGRITKKNELKHIETQLKLQDLTLQDL